MNGKTWESPEYSLSGKSSPEHLRQRPIIVAISNTLVAKRIFRAPGSVQECLTVNELIPG
jgi:hypothetical protein